MHTHLKLVIMQLRDKPFIHHHPLGDILAIHHQVLHLLTLALVDVCVFYSQRHITLCVP